ncbi:MAG: hypothetical protein ACPIOQ_48445, partial [Promethearchaeia archaeon]
AFPRGPNDTFVGLRATSRAFCAAALPSSACSKAGGRTRHRGSCSSIATNKATYSSVGSVADCRTVNKTIAFMP